jgi:hypothetical protein
LLHGGGCYFLKIKSRLTFNQKIFIVIPMALCNNSTVKESMGFICLKITYTVMVLKRVVVTGLGALTPMEIMLKNIGMLL